MMNQDPVRVSLIHWTQVFPFLRLFRAAPLGCSLSALFLAWFCLAISWAGSHWILLALSGNSSRDGSQLLHSFPVDELAEFRRDRVRFSVSSTGYPELPPVLPATVGCLGLSASHTFLGRDSSALLFGWPQRQCEFHWLLPPVLMIWNALVLGFFGTAIARMTASRFCRETRTGSRTSVTFAFGNSRAVLLSSALLIVFLAVCRGVLCLANLVVNLGTAGSLAVSLVWLAVVLVSVVLFLMYLIGGVAWMLSLAAIGTDRCSGADALSRSVSYILSHRLLTLLCVTCVAGTAMAVHWIIQLILNAGLSALPSQLLEADRPRRVWMLVLRISPDVAQLAVVVSGMSLLYILLRQREDGIQTEEMDGAA